MGAGHYVFALVNISLLTLLYLGVAYAYGNITNAIFGFLLASYAVLYLGIGRLIVYGLRRVASFSMLGSFLILVLILLAGTGLPFLVETTTNAIRVARYPILQYPSPYWTLQQLSQEYYSDFEKVALGVTIFSLATIVMLINLAMASYEAMQMRVSKPKRVREDDLEKIPPPEQVVTSPWGDKAKPLVIED